MNLWRSAHVARGGGSMDWNYLFTSFDGRISRQPFWIGTIVLWVVSLIANFIIGLIFGSGALGNILAFLVGLALLYPSLAVAAKRWHDRDKSGWWSLILLIPFIGWIWYLVECGCLPGTPGPNRFGPDPLSGPVMAGSTGPILRS